MEDEKKDGQPGRTLLAGIDVGSTTTKIAVADPRTGEVVYAD